MARNKRKKRGKSVIFKENLLHELLPIDDIMILES